jgi:alpha-tubulin suppressor-like RCC1 family protein
MLSFPGDGSIFTWGRGEYGQLGHGDRSSVMLPKLVECLLPHKIRQLSLGTSHSAAITDNGLVFTWGYPNPNPNPNPYFNNQKIIMQLIIVNNQKIIMQ